MVRFLIVRMLPFALVFLAVAAPVFAAPVQIIFEAIDEVDDVSGEDRWTYHYRLDEFPYSSEVGFSIFFDREAYSSLKLFGSEVAWNFLVVPPDPLLPDRGYFDALLVADSQGRGFEFDVSFVWTGAGQPGSQPFTVYDTRFLMIENGDTVPLPEPGLATLLGVGIAGLVAVGRRS